MEHEPSHTINEEKRVVGHHEAGHALVAIESPNITFVSATAEPSGPIRGLTQAIIWEGNPKHHIVLQVAFAAGSEFAETITGNHNHRGCAGDHGTIEQARAQATVIFGSVTANALVAEGQSLARHIIYSAGRDKIIALGDTISGESADQAILDMPFNHHQEAA